MPVSMAVLSQCSLWAGLPPGPMKELASQMRLLPMRRREVLGSPEAPFTGLGVVLSGQLQALDETMDGREVALQKIQSNGVFGLGELLADRSEPLTWVANAHGTAVGLLERSLAQQFLDRPEVASRAARLLAQRLSDIQSLHKVLSVHPVSARVCAWLAWQAQHSVGLVMPPTHAELAWQLNTTRESVTRVLQRLQADGVIEREQDAWRIVQAAVLLDWSRGKGREGA